MAKKPKKKKKKLAAKKKKKPMLKAIDVAKTIKEVRKIATQFLTTVKGRVPKIAAKMPKISVRIRGSKIGVEQKDSEVIVDVSFKVAIKPKK